MESRTRYILLSLLVRERVDTETACQIGVAQIATPDLVRFFQFPSLESNKQS